MTFEQALTKGVLNMFEQERRALWYDMKTLLTFGMLPTFIRAVPHLIRLSWHIRKLRAELKRLTASSLNGRPQIFNFGRHFS